MPSSTKVAGVWRNIVGQYVNVGGVWRSVHTTWVNVAGVWKSTWNAMTFKSGYNDGHGSATKLADCVSLYAESAGTDTAPGSEYSGEVHMVTVQTVNLTGVTNIQIDWAVPQGNAENGFIVSTSQMGSNVTYNARIVDYQFARKTSTLNVSTLNGMFYLRAYVYSSVDMTGWGELRVYRIFLDGSEVWNASNAGSWV